MKKKDFSPSVKKLKDVPMDNVDNTLQFESYLKTKQFNQLYDKMLWGEGPCYIPNKDLLVWSDIPNDRMLQLHDNKISEFKNPANFCNGNTTDTNDNLISCSHGGRCLYIYDDDFNRSLLIDKFEGKKFNSPNDICVKSDGTIWFIDPPYGILSDYEGYPGDQEYGGCYVFKYDPHTNILEVILKDLDRPNGIAFSSDESKIYIADTGENIKYLYVYDLDKNDDLINKKLIYDFKPFFSDGFRSDIDGNIWTSAGKGIKCFNPDGNLIGQLLVPELVSNLEFGGPEGNILYITATSSLYSMELKQTGAKFKK